MQGRRELAIRRPAIADQRALEVRSEDGGRVVETPRGRGATLATPSASEVCNGWRPCTVAKLGSTPHVHGEPPDQRPGRPADGPVLRGDANTGDRPTTVRREVTGFIDASRLRPTRATA